MYVITNRAVIDKKEGLAQFGPKPNDQGPNELRLADVQQKGKKWIVDFLEDELSQTEASALIKKFNLPLDPKAQYYASLKAACDIAERARKSKSHILFFVHGYNNNLEDVLSCAMEMSKRYGIEVLPFSWPANGGGISGTASYKSDKRDARASTGALERALLAIHKYLDLITSARRAQLYDIAEKENETNPEARDALYSKLLAKECPFTLNALFHSMGNYLFKQMLKSNINEGADLTFDNVILAAADANNQDHDLWVERVRFRKRCFVTINENDFALRASRAKAGSDQLARLGHYLRNLNAANAHYINFTDSAWVSSSHSYFCDDSMKNQKVHDFFTEAFSGGTPESKLRFHVEGNWYGI
ncbi:MAG: alpha/beta hydrolase [Woeseiaceae bacterium]